MSRAPARSMRFRRSEQGRASVDRGVPCGSGESPSMSDAVWDVTRAGRDRVYPFGRAPEHGGEDTDRGVRAERQARPVLTTSTA